MLFSSQVLTGRCGVELDDLNERQWTVIYETGLKTVHFGGNVQYGPNSYCSLFEQIDLLFSTLRMTISLLQIVILALTPIYIILHLMVQINFSLSILL